jgi:phosphopantothenoylcysteine decarboxylase/phosphopantothenate--cysteine ligase
LHNSYFQNKTILVTAGPTYEKLDPVRFIGNFSTGKMGIEIALKLAENGAQVHLVIGPTCLSVNHPNINVHHIVSALEMKDACLSYFPNCDMAILSAAVADYRPSEYQTQKIKKKEETFSIQLTKNPDIFKTLGELKQNHQKIIGFALETQNEIENAKQKLISKNGDAIVLNSLNDEGAGFGKSTNKISVILKNGLIFDYSLKEKSEVAKDLLKCISENL